jgi:amino acid adenylation domain-containing protein
MLPAILAKYWRNGGSARRVDGAWTLSDHETLLDADECRALVERGDELDAILSQDPEYFAWRPLSGNARALWFQRRVAPASVAYHCTAVLSLRGDVGAERVFAAFDRICLRHAMLRAQFGERDGEPCWRNLDAHANAWHRHDAVADIDAASAVLLADADLPLALERGEVMRAGCVQAGDRLVVGLTVHHLVADFYSCELVARELVQELAGETIPEPTIDYAYWRRESDDYEASARGSEALAYWRDLLHAAPATLDLPTDRVRPAVRQWRGERLEIDLDAALAARVRAVAADLKVTPYTVLLATYLTWLRRLGGQDDFVVGTPTLGRHASRHRRLVGYLANPVPVRARFAAGDTFAAHVAALKTQLDASLRRQRWPLARLVDEIAPPRRADRAPLFQHFFTYSQARHGWGDALSLEALHMGMRGAAHELILTVFEDGERLRCQIGYDEALYDRATARAWLDGYAALVAAAVAAPHADLDAIGWPARANADEAGATIDRGALHAVARIDATPGTRTALLVGDTAIDYATLRGRARTLAGALAAYGGEVVGIALPRSAAQIEAMLATWQAGRAWLALDPRLPAERLALMVDDSGARIVLGDGERPAWLPQTVAWAAPDALPRAAFTAPAYAHDDVAYLIYTSGSTGRPKGVAVTQANLCTYVAGVLERVQPGDDAVFATFATASADLGHTSLFGALLGGVTLRLVDDELSRDPPALADHLERHPVDVLKIVPSHLEALLVADRPERLLPRRALVCGGEALPWPLVERVRQLAPQCRVFNHYGPTETTVGATCIDAALAPQGTASVAIGLPLAHYRTYVVDAQGRDVPDGAIGELVIGGAGVARGYWRRDDLTAERFVADPREPGARAYRTGDRVQRLAGGALAFHGRIDDQVKIRGYRVEPGEVAQRLRALPGVEQAVVLAHETHGTRSLVAFWRGAANDPLAALAASLPDWMVPARALRVDAIPVTANGKVDRAMLLALVDATPSSEAGGSPLDAFESRFAALWQPLFPGVALGADAAFFALGGDSIAALKLVASARKEGLALTPAMLVETPTLRALAERLRPDSALRATLLALWRDVLGREVSADDDFFVLGGDSIATLKLVAGARKAGIALTPALVVEHRSIAALAAHLATSAPVEAVVQAAAPFSLIGAADATRLRAARPDAIDAFGLSPLQEGLLFNALAAPDAGHYVNQEVLRVTGALDELRLRAAFEALLERHDGLRVGFDWEHAGRPLQWLRAGAVEAWRREDWCGRGDATLEGDLAALCERERSTPFALDAPGLVRLTVVVGDAATWLVLTVHHLVIDRWSAALVFDEIAALYDGRALPPAPRWRDYIAWLGTRSHDADTAFWRDALTELDVGEPLPAPATARAGTHTVRASVDATALRACAASLAVPLTSLLQAAWALLLGRYTNATDVCFGLTVSGRPPAFADAQRIAGLFINTVPMRVALDGDDTFAALGRRVRDASFAAQAHDGLPLAQIAALAGVSGSAALFRTLLVVENIPFAARATLADGAVLERVTATSATHLPLVVQLTPDGDTLEIVLQSRRDALDDAFVARALADWQHLLAQLPALVDTRIGAICPIAPHDWPAWRARGQGARPTFAGGTMPASLADVVEDIAVRHAEQPALTDGDTTLTYAALDRAANRLAHRLRALGVVEGDRVALVADRSIAITVALLAVLKAGAAYVPLDPEHPRERLAFVVGNAGCRLVLACGDACAALDAAPVTVVDLDDAALHSALAHEPDTNPMRTHDADATAYVLYTSGSTGQPKGVLVPHRGPLHLMLAVHALLPAAPGDRVLQFTGLHFDMSVLEWLCAWTQGACLHLVPRDVTRSGEALLTRLDEARITHLVTQPAVLAPLDPPALPLLRHVLVAGDVCPDELAARWARGRVFHNAYGPTETSVIVTAEPWQAGRALTLGTALPHVECQVLDRHGQPSPAGCVGELYVAGDYLATGYLGLPEKTAAAFVTPAEGPLAGVRLYATGDRVRRRDDGRHEFLGRRDHQVKIRGLRIELGEIEAALRETAGVNEAVALVHRAGTDAACIVAFVQGDADAAVLRDTLHRRLPPHAQPAHIEVAASLPQTASRKIDRRALSARIESVLRPAVHVPPANDTEARLAALWRELFSREVGVTDDFFALGGHSLVATRLASAIAREFELRLDLPRLFAATTVREQALVIDALRAADAPPHGATVIESGYL